jgi:polyisoprenoid-binding protein YceI
VIRSIRKHWIAWLIGVVVVAVAGIVGGPYLYIHVFNGNEAAPLAISDTGSTASAAVPVDGTWKVGTGSQAGYRVHESLAGQSTTAVGRTGKVTGSAVISGSQLGSATFTVDMASVTSDKSQRDDRFRSSSVLDTSQYPNGTFTLTQPVALGTVPAPGTKVTEHATGNLTLHGVTKTVNFEVTAVRSGSTIQVQGSIPVTFSDFNVTAPDFAGFVTVDHSGQVEFLLNLTRS